ncbi:hypothetical protein BU24DRAFT_423085 [Aaosphaeria arxii CBS 175.79]|uniref:F-box domain-containing protein n=1 Tax=Aaosphaeria arxii CBS 175.79 TaxID=1450172 RepID=A0A6A5XUT8_9PLEO|nr:uncharacterized protein BU24DRAFT_423085 [Aaosphaeria arxii CBS 175.79]KAF2016723.1 hypothetical protein BU24DRAFT_423085 [Aaosphaeria arxii CBS 175.79]
MARSRQFAHTQLYYSKAAFDIISMLREEGVERLQNSGRTKSPSLGACIRKITFGTHPKCLAAAFGIAVPKGLLELDVDEQRRRRDHVCESYLDTYIPSFIPVLSSQPTILPRLETLVLANTGPIQRDMAEAIVSSTLQHLTLKRVQVDRGTRLAPDICKWRLKSLYLDLDLILSESNRARIDKPASPLIGELLSLAAPTLERLAWIDIPNPGIPVVLADAQHKQHIFGQLKELMFRDPWKQDHGWLELLIQPQRCSLIRFVDISIDNYAIADFLGRCGHLPKLEIFVCNGSPWHYLDLSFFDLSFFRANTHIQKLKVEYMEPSYLGELLPLLSKEFLNLTSLSLSWPMKSNHIPQRDLDHIAAIQSLKQLELKGGLPPGSTWLIDHNAILDCVQKLPNLQRLAFSRDSYSGEDPGLERPSEGHWVEMVVIAAGYARKVPLLEWIFVGQLLISIHRQPRCLGIEYLPPNELSYFTYLNRVFGEDSEFFYREW